MRVSKFRVPFEFDSMELEIIPKVAAFGLLLLLTGNL